MGFRLRMVLLILSGLTVSGCHWQARSEDVAQAARTAIRNLLDQQQLKDVQIDNLVVLGEEQGEYLGTVWLVDDKGREFEVPFRGKIQPDRSLGVALRLPRLPHLERQAADSLADGLRNRYEAGYRVEAVDLYPATDDDDRFHGLAQVSMAEGNDQCLLDMQLIEDGKFELKWRLLGVQRLRDQVAESIRRQIQEQGLEEFRLELGDFSSTEQGKLRLAGILTGTDQIQNPVTIELDWEGEDKYRVDWHFDKAAR